MAPGVRIGPYEVLAVLGAREQLLALMTGTELRFQRLLDRIKPEWGAFEPRFQA
jgi:hypothetical protein